MEYREIQTADIPSVIEVRLATDENRFTREELARHGITENTIAQKLSSTGKGWLCETGGTAIGFAIADSETAELWLIAVLPDYIGKGIGTTLLMMAEDWLRKLGKHRMWLITDPDKKLRAWKFYTKHGWKEIKTENGILFMDKYLV